MIRNDPKPVLRSYISFTQAANENVIRAHSLDTTSAKPLKKVPCTVERRGL